MFSVRTENILMNYFIVLVTVGLVFVTSYSIYTFILLLLLIFSGLLLYFDRYFFFKISFLIIVIFTIVWILFFAKTKILIILILFITLSQLCLVIAYLLLFPFLLLYFGFVEFYLISAILIFSLIFSYFWGIKKFIRNFYSRLVLTEGKNSVSRHNFGNLCTILFFQNKDRSLEPVLEKIRLNLNSEISTNSNSKCSIAGLLRMTIYLLEYDYNLSVKDNFLVIGDNPLWICFFYHLLENYAVKGSTVVIKENSVLIFLKKCSQKELKSFLKNHSLYNNSEISKNVLKIYYGM